MLFLPITFLASVASAAAVAPRQVTTNGVNGESLRYVEREDHSGVFVHRFGERWVEKNATTTARYDEIGRDEWSVYMCAYGSDNPWCYQLDLYTGYVGGKYKNDKIPGDYPLLQKLDVSTAADKLPVNGWAVKYIKTSNYGLAQVYEKAWQFNCNRMTETKRTATTLEMCVKDGNAKSYCYKFDFETKAIGRAYKGDIEAGKDYVTIKEVIVDTLA